MSVQHLGHTYAQGRAFRKRGEHVGREFARSMIALGLVAGDEATEGGKAALGGLGPCEESTGKPHNISVTLFVF